MMVSNLLDLLAQTVKDFILKVTSNYLKLNKFYLILMQKRKYCKDVLNISELMLKDMCAGKVLSVKLLEDILKQIYLMVLCHDHLYRINIKK